MPFSFQANAAPLQRYAKAYDNNRSNSQYNGQFSQMNPMTPRPGGTNPGPMKMPDMGRGYGNVRQYPPIPRPDNVNPGPMKPPEEGQFDASMNQPWRKDPKLMQWLMSMFGSGRPDSKGWL